MATTSNFSFVNKIPPDFVDRTIARLLPSEDEIATYTKEQLVALGHRVDDLRRVIPVEPIRYYLPNPGGQWDFVTDEDPTLRVQLFVAGNKSGKTTAGAVKMAEAMCGEMLWGHSWRPPKQFKTPCYGAVFAEAFDNHKEVTLPNYLSWCPRRFIKDIKRNPQGSVVHIEHTNGSFLFFGTYEQGSDKVEGKDWHIIWDDEPPPRPIYTAQLRGIVTLNGKLYITATLLKETWLYDEVEGHEFVKNYPASIYDNPWLSDEARRDFINSLTDDERSVRVDGKPISLTGLIYKEFRDSAPYVIPEQDFNPTWPVVMVVDPHERKPLYIMWALVTPSNKLIFFDYILAQGPIEYTYDIHSSLSPVREQIMARENQHGRPSVLTIMDPNRGQAKQLGGMCWREVFESWGFGVELGNDDIRIGHSMVHTYLGNRRLFFTENLRGKGGPIYHLLRYAWDDWAARSRQNKTIREKPAEFHKDFPDLIRYACMADLDFDILKYGPKVISRVDLSKQYRFGIRTL